MLRQTHREISIAMEKQKSATGTPGDRDDVIRRLSDYVARADELLELLKTPHAIDKNKVRQLYTSFKADLTADSKRGSTQRGEASLTEIERMYFQGAVHEAMCRLTAATNSDPVNSRWFDCIYSARIDLDYQLTNLQEYHD